MVYLSNKFATDDEMLKAISDVVINFATKVTVVCETTDEIYDNLYRFVKIFDIIFEKTNSYLLQFQYNNSHFLNSSKEEFLLLNIKNIFELCNLTSKINTIIAYKSDCLTHIYEQFPYISESLSDTNLSEMPFGQKWHFLESKYGGNITTLNSPEIYYGVRKMKSYSFIKMKIKVVEGKIPYKYTCCTEITFSSPINTAINKCDVIKIFLKYEFMINNSFIRNFTEHFALIYLKHITKHIQSINKRQDDLYFLNDLSMIKKDPHNKIKFQLV